MLIRPRRPWSLSENEITPESTYLNRRQVLAGMGFGVAATAISGSVFAKGVMAAVTGIPAERNPAFVLDRDITDEEEATTYTNFYEFGSSKNIWRAAQKLVTDPWAVTIDGMVEEDITIDAEDLVAKLGGVEERLYRHRCVEAWAMAVPWTGIPLKKLVEFARPDAGAKYLRIETFHDTSIASGQHQGGQIQPVFSMEYLSKAPPLPMLQHSDGDKGVLPPRPIKMARRSGWFCLGNMGLNRSNLFGGSPLRISNR